jgi:hypothetical protein
MGIQEDLDRARKQWKLAQKRKDRFMMNQWEKNGKKILEEIKKRIKGE